MLKKNPSADSWESPWSSKKMKKQPLIVPQSQSVRNVTLMCCLLCFLSVFFVGSGLILIGISVWSLVRKIPYAYIVDIKVDIPYFTLPAAVLCLPCAWISMSIHNNRKKYQFLHLLIFLLIVSAALLITGCSIGMIYDTKSDPNTTVLSTSLNMEDLNTSLQISIYQYDTNSNYKFAWNGMQTQLGCCGINNYYDWIKVGRSIPNSCCKDEICNSKNVNLRGCLDSLSRDLTWHRNILTSQSYMTVVIQVTSIIMCTAVYFSEKYNN